MPSPNVFEFSWKSKRNDEHIPKNTIRNIWRRLLSKSGIEHRKLHCTRHPFASHLLMQGESLAYVKDQLGHSSIQTTVDIYGHFIPGSNRQAVNRLDDIAPNCTLSAPIQNEKAVTS
ncbi:MAG: tyrosine-type recombinase/integrase [Thermodesulfobacteriota bacterium]|nr:tyrosine-type recombinase/integrase [Thermodesulfobacteriota bacterium]